MNPAAALLAGMRPPMLNPLLAAGLRPGGLPGIPSMPGGPNTLEHREGKQSVYTHSEDSRGGCLKKGALLASTGYIVSDAKLMIPSCFWFMFIPPEWPQGMIGHVSIAMVVFQT